MVIGVSEILITNYLILQGNEVYIDNYCVTKEKKDLG